MQIRRFIIVGLGAAVAACGSMAGAIGVLSPPQSAPVGLSVYRYNSAYAWKNTNFAGSSRYVALDLVSEDELHAGAGVAIPPAGAMHSESKQYWGYASQCMPNQNYWYCSTLASAFGSFSRNDLKVKPLAGTIRFKKQASCGLINVLFKPARVGQVQTDQAIAPDSTAIPQEFRFSASRYTNATAHGTMCGYRLDSSNVWLSDNITASLFRR